MTSRSGGPSFVNEFESICNQRNLPDSLRVTAAWAVAHGFQGERPDSQALDRFRSAYDLVPPTTSNAGNAWGR